VYNHDPALSLRNVAVSYRRRAGVLQWSKYWALKDVSFDVYHGETLGVIGKNGAGKSTLLRVLAGIIAPDRGEIRVNDCRVSLLSLQVGFIQHLTGRQNAILSGMLLGLRRREVEERMDEIVAFSELDEFMDEPVRSYSTGMRARLGFSVAFQADPDVLLVDEVLGVGDMAFRKKSSEAMRERIRSNKTVVLVSHGLQTIEDLCDRVIWIDSGKSREEGSVKRILELYEAQQSKPRLTALRQRVDHGMKQYN
jgi:lipopolysaccharide transport system ATP-binding protein